MRAPAFQFYADDFYSGVAIFSQAETGAYIRLLCQQWNLGGLPDSSAMLERLAGGPVSDAVMEKFPIGEDGQRRNARMENERSKQESYRKERAESGKRGAESRWHGSAIGSANGSAIKEPMAKRWPPSPSPSPISVPVSDSATAPLPKNKPRSAPDGFAVPPCFENVDGFAVALAGWIESRKAQRKPATGHAIQLLINRLAEQPNRAVLALNTATERGWLTVKWEWLDNQQRVNGHTAKPTTCIKEDIRPPILYPPDELYGPDEIKPNRNA